MAFVCSDNWTKWSRTNENHYSIITISNSLHVEKDAKNICVFFSL